MGSILQQGKRYRCMQVGLGAGGRLRQAAAASSAPPARARPARRCCLAMPAASAPAISAAQVKAGQSGELRHACLGGMCSEAAGSRQTPGCPEEMQAARRSLWCAHGLTQRQPLRSRTGGTCCRRCCSRPPLPACQPAQAGAAQLARTTCLWLGGLVDYMLLQQKWRLQPVSCKAAMRAAPTVCGPRPQWPLLPCPATSPTSAAAHRLVAYCTRLGVVVAWAHEMLGSVALAFCPPPAPRARSAPRR